MAASQPSSTISAPAFLMSSVATLTSKFFRGPKCLAKACVGVVQAPCGIPYGEYFGVSVECTDKRGL